MRFHCEKLEWNIFWFCFMLLFYFFIFSLTNALASLHFWPETSFEGSFPTISLLITQRVLMRLLTASTVTFCYLMYSFLLSRCQTLLPERKVIHSHFQWKGLVAAGLSFFKTKHFFYLLSLMIVMIIYFCSAIMEKGIRQRRSSITEPRLEKGP